MKSRITKNAIEAAFLKLLADKPFDKITVRDIVDECGLTRNTFYYYYEDTYDIVDDVLCSEAQRLIASVSGDLWEACIMAAVRYASENQRLVAHLLKSSKRDELDIYFRKAIEIVLDSYIGGIEGDAPMAADDRRMIIDVVRCAMTGVLSEWLLLGKSFPVADEIRRAGVVFDGVVHRAVERARSNPRS